MNEPQKTYELRYYKSFSKSDEDDELIEEESEFKRLKVNLQVFVRENLKVARLYEDEIMGDIIVLKVYTS